MPKRTRASTTGQSASGPSSEIFVHWVNVIILAEYHNPSVLNPDFLAKKIVPRDWDVAQSVSTPAVANIVYANGLRLTVDQSRLEVRRDINDQIQESYDVFGMQCVT